jgi:hypothetical protein
LPEFERRETVVLDLPISDEKYLERPEQIILRFSPGKSIDFGEFCFLTRSRARREKNQGRKVVLSSISAERIGQVRKLIFNANHTFNLSGSRSMAINNRYDRFMGFLDWCDRNGHSDILSSVDATRSALRDRSRDLRRKVDQHDLHNNSAALEQLHVIDVLEDFFQVDDLVQGLNQITFKKALAVSTVVPDEEAQEKVLACCVALFSGVCDLLLRPTVDGRPVPFPYPLKVPPFINQRDDILWIFPQRQWFGHQKSSWNAAYDYETGRVRTVEELIRSAVYGTRRDTERAVTAANAHMLKANLDSHHWARIDRGMLGLVSFYVMFLAVTGLNESTASLIPWSEELERNVNNPETYRQGFRSIKYRAGGRLVSFEIGLRYMPYLKQFLALRAFLLQGKKCESLFFVRQRDRTIVSLEKSNSRLALAFYKRLENLIPGLPRLASKMWRAAKQDHMIRKADPATAALVMQHSLPTAIKAYSNGSQATHESEVGEFLTQLERVVLSSNIASNDVVLRAIGGCSSPNNPVPMDGVIPIEPDCHRAEGCLFCSQYRIHIDERDARKLLSARHCLRISASHGSAAGLHLPTFEVLLNRIDEYLNLLRKENSEMVLHIEDEVDRLGELDPFWAAKLTTLLELGMSV